MARDLSNKCKLCRRATEKLFLKGDRCGTPKCAMVRKPYVPGVHGKKGRRPQGEFGQQMAMKQRVKRIYGVMERQFKKYFHDVKDKPGVTGDLLMQKLEMRLDNVIFRAGFAPSRQSARQLVGHSQFLINGKKINIPSREVKIGDVISAKPNKTKGEYFKQLAARLKEKKGGTPPSGWLETVPNEIVVKIKSKPTRNDLDLHVDAQVIVEFYSR
ncbi:MAG: 30S ribosomal protein S4 [Candidatus Moranbacteria bacterium GW2011_GWF1_44_4]|nr:MAG: 30S ribosomal protein S4 [Candidatus Moranbacteria bacterium GW2011_GWF1_44_4]